MGTYVSLHGNKFGIDSQSGTPIFQASQVVTVTSSAVSLTKQEHAGRTVVLDLAAGIAVTLPNATGTGDKYRLVVKTTFTGAASVKSSRSADIMVGVALMGVDSATTVAMFNSIASSTNDTVDLLGTSNSTGGIEGQVMEFTDIAANCWHVLIIGDAAGTEATPFGNTVS